MYRYLCTANWQVRSCGAWLAWAGLALGMLYAPVPALQAQPGREITEVQLLDAALEASVGVTWQGKPLRGALDNLAESQGIGIFLDRRIDPGQQIDFSARPMPLDELLKRLCAQLELGYCRVGEVIYIGPAETASVLETVAALRRQDEESLPNERRRVLVRETESGWENLSQPRELLAATASAAGISWEEEERVPHDLWPAVRLPRLRFADRASLILAGFGLTYALDDDGVAMAIQPLPATAVIEMVHQRGNHGDEVLAQLAAAFPDSDINATGQRIVVIGPMQDQRMIRRLLAGEPVRRRQVEEAQREYTLRVTEQPVEALVRALAQQLQMQVAFDAALGEELETRVSFSVEKVDLAELLEAALSPVGLRAEIEGNTIKVLPAGG